MHYKLRVTFVLLLVFVSCEANVNSSTRGDESADTKEQNCSKADECLVESTTSESRLVRGEAMTNFEGDFGLERKDVRDARVQKATYLHNEPHLNPFVNIDAHEQQPSSQDQVLRASTFAKRRSATYRRRLIHSNVKGNGVEDMGSQPLASRRTFVREFHSDTKYGSEGKGVGGASTSRLHARNAFETCARTCHEIPNEEEGSSRDYVQLSNGKGSWGQGSRYRSSSIKGFISEGTLNRSNGSVTNHSGSPSKGRPLESMLPSSEIVATSPSPSFSIGTCNYLCEAWVATNSFIPADEILPERTSIH